MCPIFVDSVHNFGRSDWRWHYLVKRCLFPLDIYVASCPTWLKNLDKTLLCSLQTLERIMMTNNPLGAKNLQCFELCAKYTFGPLHTLGEQNMAKSINNKKKSRRKWTKNRMLSYIFCLICGHSFEQTNPLKISWVWNWFIHKNTEWTRVAVLLEERIIIAFWPILCNIWEENELILAILCLLFV